MKFSKEYKKLTYPVFTTIRQDKGYYRQGQIIRITTPDQEFIAEILAITELHVNDITETMAYRDADCSKEELIKLMKKFYKDEYEELILITIGKFK